MDLRAHAPECRPRHLGRRLSQPPCLAAAEADGRREQMQSGGLINPSHSRPRRPLSCHSSLCAPISPAWGQPLRGPQLPVLICPPALRSGPRGADSASTSVHERPDSHHTAQHTCWYTWGQTRSAWKGRGRRGRGLPGLSVPGGPSQEGPLSREHLGLQRTGCPSSAQYLRV